MQLKNMKTKKKARQKDGLVFNKYRCSHCGKIVKRNDTRKWIKSYCTKIDKTVHLYMIKGE